jgi:hypothetical protein
LTLLVQHTGGNLSWGRNQLARACPTPFYLMLEDDFEFCASTDLRPLLDILHTDDELAGVGGIVVEGNRRRAWCHTFDRFRNEAVLLPSPYPLRVTAAGAAYRPCHAILNFGLFRRQALAELPWDEQLPLSEHRDWYYRLWREGRWRVALTHDCEVLHHRDRPEGYREDRRRSFLDRVRRKHGLRFRAPAASALDRDAHRNPQSLSNVVVLGVGHANTTITTRQLAALGWNLGDADDEFAESVSVRAINQRLVHCGLRISDCGLAESVALLTSPSTSSQSAIRNPQSEMASALSRLPRPWAVKDPRFAETLPRWLKAFQSYQPLLLWITKDAQQVAASYVRRGCSPERAASIVAAREQACLRHFQRWPWAKLRVSAEQIRTAVRLFDVDR